jgi:Domain of unknown function (DUF4190)
MRCGRCGSDLAPEARFCDICATPVGSAAPVAAAGYRVGAGPYGLSAQAAVQFGRSEPKVHGLAVTSMVLGIVSLAFIWLPLIDLISPPCAVLAVIFGFMALPSINRGERLGKGFAIAGVVTGIVTLGLVVLFLLVLTSAVHGFASVSAP